jgi:Domain of unknown function (DUF4331)
MKQMLKTFVLVYVLALAASASGCGGNSGTAPGLTPKSERQREASVQYQQIERLARPAIKEATQMFSQHEDTNRVSPVQQPLSSQSLYKSIGSFVTQAAGRRADYGTTLQSVLIPDQMTVDLSQNTTKAAYLGVETKGATGSAYGGRALTDDVITIDLSAIFGTALSDLGILSPDGKQSPCLATDNVPVDPATKHFTAIFPFVGIPN